MDLHVYQIINCFLSFKLYFIYYFDFSNVSNLPKSEFFSFFVIVIHISIFLSQKNGMNSTYIFMQLCSSALDEIFEQHLMLCVLFTPGDFFQEKAVARMSQSLSISIPIAFIFGFMLILGYKNWRPKHVLFVYIIQNGQGRGKGKSRLQK